MELTDVLFSLIRYELCGEEPSKDMADFIDDTVLRKLYKLSKAHDVAHLVGDALFKWNISNELTDGKFQEEQIKAIYRCEQMQYELTRLCEFFNQQKIAFIPLKGSVLRAYYPEPWMRTSCDIDILVHECDLERAKDLLIQKQGYTFSSKGDHDIGLFSESGVHLELHYSLVEDTIMTWTNEPLHKVWDYTTPNENLPYMYEMCDEMFYYYHVAHMAKHFLIGGCGIRPFIDLWYLDNLKATNVEKREAMLEDGGLLRFAVYARALSVVWLENKPHDDITENMQSYIISGGVYGNTENRVAIQQQKRGGKFRYILSRIFVSYDALKFQYPILQTYRFLMPLMQVRRWFRLLFCGGARRSMRELSYNSKVSKAEADATKRFLNQIGL